MHGHGLKDALKLLASIRFPGFVVPFYKKIAAGKNLFWIPLFLTVKVTRFQWLVCS